MSDYKTVFDAQPAKFPESSPHAQPAPIPPDNPRISLRRCPYLLPLYGICLPPPVRTMGAGASGLDCMAWLSVCLVFFGPMACRILVPQQWKCGVLTTEPPGKT